MNRIAAALIGVAASSAAAAQESQPPAVQVSISTNDSYRFESDLDTEGAVAVTQLKLSADVNYTAGPKDYLRLLVGADYYKYDFTGDAELLTGIRDVFEDIYVLRLEATYTHVFDSNWIGLAYASAYFLYEEGADVGDSGSYGLGVGAMYRFGPDLTLGIILRVQTRIEDSPYVFPLPIIDWRITPRLTLRNEQRMGFGYVLAYQLDEGSPWSLETRMYYSLRRFRLDEGSVPDEGVIQDDRFAWDVGLRYQPGASFSVAAYLGADLWQEYSVEAKDGDDLADVETDPAPYLALSLILTF